MQNIKNITHNILSKAWATLHRIDYDFQFKDGRIKRLSRECYNRGDGAAVLLYNIEKSTVILTKQFRMPIYENDINKGMSIEVCAGAIDKNESPESTMLREIEEEVGYNIENIQSALNAYMSPGALTEKLYLFVAEYSEDNKISEGGGLDSEDEEIEVLELPFIIALDMIKKKIIIDAKTIMLLQYAQINNLLQCKN
ncbi:NUDIX domain-containing protein [Psychroserpens ponticola]|uniref:GDP-mannose pyrophosphatase n=1 Tax=Psychroserpens ponticola TaxID=2932268 RepID=A0ABY7S218_9FLAO|nr:NUDIX domain-containing protein [Psychroserpens ponticola]WCO03322.1 NUDIX domain-containing protein [Psychroserpens ponticola]